jgi:acetyl esterase/lipase
MVVVVATAPVAGAESIDLWPGAAPDEPADVKELGEEKVLDPGGATSIMRITNVTRPQLEVFPAPADKNRGAALLIAPGGGYNILAWEHEGTEVAAWANSVGMTAFVLKYRVPRRSDQPKDKPPLQPLEDAQRAMSIVRSRASQWGIDPKRIGTIGFSAGGNLAANLATHFEKRAYQPVDTTDQTSCRPDFVALIYPGGVIDPSTGTLNPAFEFTKQSPPAFCVHATNDKGSSENSVAVYLAQKRLGLPAEMHLYALGGHGFGMRGKGAVTAWPAALEQWLRGQNFLQ